MCRPKSLQGLPEGVRRSEFSVRRSEFGVRRDVFGGQRGLRGQTTLRGNHRTEATEVTEEGIRVEHTVALVRELR
jgi:hypothetical protein